MTLLLAIAVCLVPAVALAAPSIDVTVTATGINKIYDGTTDASVVVTGAPVLVGDVHIAYTAAFVDKNVGNDTTVTVTGISLTGTDAGNYHLMNTSVSGVKADITQRAITLTSVAATKTYDGNTSSLELPVLTGSLAIGDVGTWSQAFDTAAIGTGKTLTPTGTVKDLLDANMTGNYIITRTAAASGTIQAKALTITANDKVYDGTTDATLSSADIVPGDDVTLNYTAADFASVGVGASKDVTATPVVLSGLDASNYNLIQPVDLKASITPKALTLNGAVANNKVYNGNKVATVNFGGASLAGKVGADVVAINSSGYAAEFETKTVSAATTVTVTGVVPSGADAGNYTITPPTGLKADITPAVLTITGAVANDKVYDGTTTATVDFSGASVVGTFGADVVTINSSAYTAAFDTKNVSTATTVTVTGVALSGADAGNYTVTQPIGLKADITAKELLITAVNKSYDGTATASLATTGVVTGDAATLVYTAAFNNKNVGDAKDVTVTGLVTLSGGAAGNYTVTQPTGLKADITAKALAIGGAIANNKVYNRTTTATVDFSGASLTGLVGSENVTMTTSAYAAAFDTKNVGNDTTVTVTGVTLSPGADTGNYTLTQPTILKADITAKALTITGAVANNKVFNGTTAATVNFGGASLTGVIAPDAVTVNSSAYTAAFDTSAVGTGKAVTVAGVALSGADAGNYSVTQPTGLTADITAVPTAMRTVWRFRSKTMFGSYLWTIDPSEKDTIRANTDGPWLYEGAAYTINTANPLNNATMVRFRNRLDGSYFWSADPIEIDNLTNNLSSTWIREGNAFKVSRTATGKTVWRFLCLRNNTHFWTMDPAEKQTIENTLTSDYALEGIAYYLGQ